MPSARNEFADHVVELMASWAEVTPRRMFGGYGLYRENLMFALIAEDELFFKTDGENVALFERAGSHPFTYASKTRTVQMSYWSAPAETLDAPAAMAEWCRSAFGAALRAQAGKPSKGKRK